MYSVPVGACVSSVVTWFFYEISLFSSGILGSCGVFLLVRFLCAILIRMGCGRSLSVLRILHTGMCFLPAWWCGVVVFLGAMYMLSYLSPLTDTLYTTVSTTSI